IRSRSGSSRGTPCTRMERSRVTFPTRRTTGPWERRSPAGRPTRGRAMPEDQATLARSDEDRRRILREVVATHEGNVSTHYESCWRHHAGCLAVLLVGMEEQ